MLTYLIQFSLRHRWFILGFALLIMGAGLYAFRHLPVDAYPDISPIKVSVITAFRALRKFPTSADCKNNMPLHSNQHNWNVTI